MSGEHETCLYRHYAADGTLLYVGISLSWPARTRAHSHYSLWFAQVSRVEIERFQSREAALDAERDAIRSESPKFNVIHNRSARKPSLPTGKRKILSTRSRDPLLQHIAGPHAIVGPALVYRGDTISVLVAHGTFGTEGELTELVLGERFPELPEWTAACDTVLTLRRAGEITLEEARAERHEIITTLSNGLEVVQSFETDLALATAYATQFPSEKSRQVLDRVAVERGANG